MPLLTPPSTPKTRLVGNHAHTHTISPLRAHSQTSQNTTHDHSRGRSLTPASNGQNLTPDSDGQTLFADRSLDHPHAREFSPVAHSRAVSRPSTAPSTRHSPPPSHHPPHRHSPPSSHPRLSPSHPQNANPFLHPTNPGSDAHYLLESSHESSGGGGGVDVSSRVRPRPTKP